MSETEGPSVPVPPPPPSFAATSQGTPLPVVEGSAYELSLGVLRPSHVLAGRYQITAQIGQGGMGKVYQAEDLNLKRTVVVKVAHSETKGEEKEQARFRREALKMASLSHPNIVAIYDYGEEDEVQYLVMELVDGEMIKGELREAGSFSAERFFEVMIQLLEGLSSAHGQQVIHRDIKPSNLMWDRRSSLLKILDFGLARGVEGDTLTGTGHVHGSIQYMAPEQIRGESQDERTDVYAVGVLAYQLISGQLPFGGESTVELMFHKLQYRPKPLSELLPDEGWVSPALSALIEECLEIEPALRVRDASELLARLKALKRQILETDVEAPAVSPEVISSAFTYESVVEQLDTFTSLELFKGIIRRRPALIALLAFLVSVGTLSYLTGALLSAQVEEQRTLTKIEQHSAGQPHAREAQQAREAALVQPSPPALADQGAAPAVGAGPLQPQANAQPQQGVEVSPVAAQKGASDKAPSLTPARPAQPASRRAKTKVSSKKKRVLKPLRRSDAPPKAPTSKKVEENDVPLLEL